MSYKNKHTKKHATSGTNKSKPPTKISIPVRIPHDNLAYSALIVIDEGKSKGSGFRLKIGGKNYLVTAKHVLYDRKGQLYGDNLVLTFHNPDKNSMPPCILGIDLTKATILCSDKYDVAAILIGKNIDIPGFDHITPLKNSTDAVRRPTALIADECVRVLDQGSGVAVSVDVEALGKLDSISLASDVYLMGYPTSLGMRNSEFYDFSKPLIRKGIVAGIHLKNSTFVIDSFVFPGNSGGPVVEHCADGFFRVVGIVSKYIPFETKWYSNRDDVVNTDVANSGYTVCVGMDAVLAMFDKNEVADTLAK